MKKKSLSTRPLAVDLAGGHSLTLAATRRRVCVLPGPGKVVLPMFANLHQLIHGRPPPPEVERSAFIEEVRVSGGGPERRSRRVERTILICWILIAVKHALIIWVCHRYPVPYHQLWINFPTWLLGALATAVYFLGARRVDVRATGKR